MPAFLIAIITTIHIVGCIALTVTILLQSGKGGGLAGAFGGGGGSQTLFGGRGAATFLSRATTVLAVLFFLTSLTLGLSQVRGGPSASSLIQEEARRRAGERTGTTAAPVAPAPGTPAGGTAVPGGAPAAPGTDQTAPSTPAPSGGQ